MAGNRHPHAEPTSPPRFGLFEGACLEPSRRAGAGETGGAVGTEPGRGTGIDGTPLRIDVVAERERGRDLLVGEVKWTEKAPVNRLVHDLGRKAANLPVAAGRKVHRALWVKRLPRRNPERVTVLSPRDVLAALR